MRSLTPTLTAALVVLATVGLAPSAAAAPDDRQVVEVDSVHYAVDPTDEAAGATVVAWTGGAAPAVVREDVEVDGRTYPVRHVAGAAFNYSPVTSVALPDSLRSIDDRAFESSAVTSVDLGDGLETIGAEAFARSSLRAVTLPDSLRTLGYGAFDDADLTTLTLGSGLTALPNAAFRLNALTDVTLPADLTLIGAFAFTGNALTSVTVPAAVDVVGVSAFEDNPLTSVTIGDGTRYVGSRAFAGTTPGALTSIELGGGVEHIDTGAFAGHGDQLVELPGRVAYLGEGALTSTRPWYAVFLGRAPSGSTQPFGDPAGVIIQYFYVFGEPTEPGGFTTPSWNGYVTQPLGAPASPNAAPVSQTVYLTVPAGGTASFDLLATDPDGDPLAFAITEGPSAGSLTCDTPGTACTYTAGTEMGSTYARFSATDPGGLSTQNFVWVTITAPDPVEIDGVVYEVDLLDPAAGATVVGWTGGATDAVVRESVEVAGRTFLVRHVADGAFYGAPATSLTLPDTIRTIGTYAFENSALTSADLGAGVETIGAYAFAGASLTGVVLPDSLHTLGVSAFNRNELTSLTIGTGLTAIPSNAFARNALTSVTLPSQVTSIGDWAFGNNALTSADIPGTVETVGFAAFNGNALTSVVIGDGTRTVGGLAFAWGSDVITTVELGSTLESIGESAIEDHADPFVVIPASVTSMGRSALASEDPWTARFLGAAPAGSPEPLGYTYTVTLQYWHHQGAPAVPGSFTPSWNGYDTQALTEVTFDLGGHGQAIAPLEAVVGEPLTLPDPTADGYRFLGWFADAALTEPVESGAAATAGLTLHASWVAKVAPVAAPLTVEATAGTAVTFTLPGSDADGDPLTFAVTTPSSGALTCTAAGECTYVPGDEPGEVTFDYTVTDSDGGSATGTVTVVVAAAPDDGSGTDPEDPATDPEDPGTDPEDPGTDLDDAGDADAGTGPDDAGTDPDDAGTDPDDAGTDPDDAGTDARDPGRGSDDDALATTGVEAFGPLLVAALLLGTGGLMLVARRRLV